MIIDIIIVVLLLLAVVLGIRQGLLTQICYLIAFIATSIFAPHVAAPIGSLFTDNTMIAFVIGFAIILIGAAVLVWLISPLLKKILVWDVLRKINATLGAIVAIVSTVLILSLICTTANTANLGDVNTTKMAELISSCDNEAEVEQELEKIFQKDASMRDYFEPRFIAYETLDDSMLFGFMTKLGDVVCPGLSTLQQNATNNFKTHASKAITNTFTEE